MSRSKPETLGERLRRLREVAQLTIPDLSDKSGVAVGTIWNIENGKGDTQISTLKKITAALNISISDLDL